MSKHGEIYRKILCRKTFTKAEYCDIMIVSQQLSIFFYESGCIFILIKMQAPFPYAWFVISAYR